MTLQMFVACGGLHTLTELLDEDYANSKELVLTALAGVSSVFDLQVTAIWYSSR